MWQTEKDSHILKELFESVTMARPWCDKNYLQSETEFIVKCHRYYKV